MLVDAALDSLIDAFEAGFGNDATYLLRHDFGAAEPVLRTAWHDGSALAAQRKRRSIGGPGSESRILLN